MKKFLVSFISLSCLFWLQVQAQAESFTATEWATAQSLSTGDAVSSYTASPITVSFAQGIGSAVTYNGTAIAAGEGNTLTITATSGYQLTAMSFTQNVAAQATRLAGNTWSAGSASVNAQNNKQVDWTGAAQTVSVSFTGNQVFTAFSVTYEDMNKSFTVTFVGADGTILKTESVLYGNAATPPTPPAITNKIFTGWDKDYTNITEDITITALYDFSPAVMNDTVIITPKEIMDYNELTSGEKFENVDFTKGNVTIAIGAGSRENENDYPHIDYDYYRNGYIIKTLDGNTFTITSKTKMHKVIINVYALYNGLDEISCDKGELSLGEKNGYVTPLVWTGGTFSLTFTIKTYSYDRQFMDFTIIGDKTDTQCNVTFYDMKGSVLKTEKVSNGGSATAPAITHECFNGWDKSLTNITSDLEVYPLYRIDGEFPMATWWKNANSALSYTDNSYTFSVAYTKNTEPVWYNNYVDGVSTRCLVLTSNSVLTIKNDETFRSFAIRTISEERAAYLAASKCNTGSLRQSGATVFWSGATTQLEITYPSDVWNNADIISFGYPCKYYELVPCTVIFLDKDGKELKRETVIAGNAATAPANPTGEECEQFVGWDKDFSKVLGDMTIRPVFETKKKFSISAYEWNKEKTINRYADTEMTQGPGQVLHASRAQPHTDYQGQELPAQLHLHLHRRG